MKNLPSLGRILCYAVIAACLIAALILAPSVAALNAEVQRVRARTWSPT